MSRPPEVRAGGSLAIVGCHNTKLFGGTVTAISSDETKEHIIELI
jgi:hypothetical protein